MAYTGLDYIVGTAGENFGSFFVVPVL